MARIVSLLPSATEIVSALGFQSDLVGRSHECDYPAGVEALPVCTAPKIDVTATSPAIDREVRTLLRQALSIYDLDLELMRALRPDLVVTQTQCEVCAVPLAQVERAVKQCLADAARVVALEPVSLEAVWKDIARVAAALGRPERGRLVIGELSGRMQAIAGRAAAIGTRPSLACIEWIDPLMTAGNWMPELVEKAGGRNCFGEAGLRSAYLSWDALRAADPDAILVLPCGFDLARTRAEAGALRDLPGWDELAAVSAGRVFLTDGHQYFNRPGPRLVESLEILAEVLFPDEFHFGFEGKGWERMTL